jgi:hypothetical protein
VCVGGVINVSVGGVINVCGGVINMLYVDLLNRPIYSISHSCSTVTSPIIVAVRF